MTDQHSHNVLHLTEHKTSDYFLAYLIHHNISSVKIKTKLLLLMCCNYLLQIERFYKMRIIPVLLRCAEALTLLITDAAVQSGAN